MNDKTRLLFESDVLQALAEGYGVADVSRQFSIEPSIVQQLNDKIVEKSTFLQKINIVPVEEIKGQNVLGFASTPVTSRTDTSGDGERKPIEALGLGKYEYELHQTNTDVAIKYRTIDAWAKFPDLADRYAGYVQERMAGDRELIGWHGTSAAATTNMGTNPLLQDVNRGWMQYMREYLPANILTQGNTAGKIRLGAGGDWSCLDVAVNDLLQGIPYYMQKDLVAFIGRDLLVREKGLLYEAIQGKPTEKAGAEEFYNLVGGLNWETPSFFPARGIVITSYANLSVYHQDSSWRRKIQDKPEKDQYEDFNSRNEGYVVEEPEAFVAVDFSAVEIPNGEGGWG